MSAMCGGTVRYERNQFECPVCHIADSWVVTGVPSSPYWGGITTCTNCGDSWGEGQLMPRPFLRGWRQKSVEMALKDWEQACDCRVEWDDDFMLKPCKHEQATA